MKHRSKTPGISRIDQPSHRTHGFFARVPYQGDIYSAFFSDKKFGGKRIALVAAQQFQIELRRRLGMSGARSRRRKRSMGKVWMMNLCPRSFHRMLDSTAARTRAMHRRPYHNEKPR
jgi:hypothetical protein